MYTITGQYKIIEKFLGSNSINNQLDTINQKIANLENKLNNSEINIDEINNRVSNNENKINENYNYLKNEVDIVNQKFDQLYDKLNTDVNDLNNKVTNLLSTFNFLHNTQDKYFNYNLQNLSKKIYEISEFIGAPTTKKFTDWFQISNDLVSWINVEYDDTSKKITIKFIDTPYDKNSQYKLRFYMKVNHSTLSEVDEEVILNEENERLGTMDEIITAEKEKSEVMKNDELGAKLEEEEKAREIMDSYGIEFFSDSMLDFNQIRKLNKVCDIGKIYNNVKLDKNESKEIIIDLNEYCNVTEFNYLILKRTTLYDLDEYKIKTFYFILDKKTSIYTLFGSLFINRFTKINLRIINPDGSEPIFKIKIDYKLVEDRFSNEILLILLDTKDFEFELEIIDRFDNVNYYNNNLLKDKIFANLSLFKVTVPSAASVSSAPSAPSDSSVSMSVSEVEPFDSMVDFNIPAISDIDLDKIDLKELSNINDLNLPELEFDSLKFKNVSTNEYKMMLIIQLLKNNIDNFLQSKSYGLTGLNNDSSEMPSDYYSSVYKDMDIIITDKDDIDERLDIFDKMEVLQAILLKVNNQLNINIKNLDSNNIKLIKNSSDIARNNTMVSQFAENIQSTKDTLDRVNDFLNSFKDDEVFKQKLVDLGFTRMNTPIKLKEMDTNKESSRFKLLN